MMDRKLQGFPLKPMQTADQGELSGATCFSPLSSTLGFCEQKKLAAR